MWSHCQTRDHGRTCYESGTGGRVTRRERGGPGKKGAAPLHWVSGTGREVCSSHYYAFTLWHYSCIRLRPGSGSSHNRTRNRALPPTPCVGLPRRAATVGSRGRASHWAAPRNPLGGPLPVCCGCSVSHAKPYAHARPISIILCRGLGREGTRGRGLHNSVPFPRGGHGHPSAPEMPLGCIGDRSGAGQGCRRRGCTR